MPARIVQADQDPGNWLTTGRTYSEQRFSPLAKIDANNVKQLGLAWFVDLDTHRGQEATPLIIDGVLYSTSAWSKVQAIDAASGKLLWQYDPKVPGETGVKACCDTVNRGVAAYEGKLFVGTLDGRLVALDAATGNEVWSVVTVDQTKAYTITGAPRVIKGKVIIGNGGAEYGVRGYISAYDAQTGKMLWRFYTVPGDPRSHSKRRSSRRPRRPGTASGGSSAAAAPSGIRWPTTRISICCTSAPGNGSPWNQQYRSPGGGDNLFLSAIVALKPDTGEYVWHYQSTPGETWDFTATQHIVLADLTIDGQPRKVLMQAPKNGFFYVIDRTNGKLISAQPFVPVNWAKEIDLKTGPAGRGSSVALHEPEAACAGRARTVRRAQLASDVVQPADRSGVLARARAGHGVSARSEVQGPAARLQHRHRCDGRDDAGGSADPRRRACDREGLAQGVGSGHAESEVVGRSSRRLERRRAVDGRQSRLPRQRRRRIRRLQRERRHEAVVVPGADRCRRCTGDVLDRR
jgi:PQQ-dependent dehydrogenase (methanol/ethanol family)